MSGYTGSVTASGTFGVPAIDENLTKPSRGLYVGSTGDLTVVPWNGSAAVTFVGVPAGSLLPIVVRKIMPATTAGDLVILY